MTTLPDRLNTRLRINPLVIPNGRHQYQDQVGYSPSNNPNRVTKHNNTYQDSENNDPNIRW